MVSMVKNEIDDLDRFMKEFAESEVRAQREIKELQLKSQMPQSVVPPKEERGPQRPGGFISGDFDSFTMTNNRNNQVVNKFHPNFQGGSTLNIENKLDGRLLDSK